MSVAVRIASSFREELRRPSTQAYLLCTAVVLIAGALVWKGVWTGSSRSVLMRVLQGFVLLFVIFTMAIDRGQFWKRLGFVAITHAIFLPLYFSLSSNIAFLKAHEQLATSLLVVLMLVETALLVTLLNKVFPHKQTLTAVEGQES
jgi:hypothetical protein